jgi:hypothetical protein
MTRLVPIGRAAIAEAAARPGSFFVTTETRDALIPIFRHGLAHSI